MGYCQTRVYLREEPKKNHGSKGKRNNKRAWIDMRM